MRQIELICEEDPRRQRRLPAKLDEKTLRQLVALMAEAILAVHRREKGAGDER